MRFLFVLCLLIVSDASAQTPDVLAAHLLPFAAGGHTLELALGGDAAKTGGALSVAVASAPAWLVFDQTQATAGLADGEPEPVARLTFTAERSAPIGTPGEIRLAVRDAAGTVVAEKVIRVEVSAPLDLSVEPPRPNPSRGAVTVPYAVPEAGRVRVSVVDLLGREVLVLVDTDEAAGAHEARVPEGRLAAGVYAVRVIHGVQARTARLTIVR